MVRFNSANGTSKEVSYPGGALVFDAAGVKGIDPLTISPADPGILPVMLQGAAKVVVTNPNQLTSSWSYAFGFGECSGKVVEQTLSVSPASYEGSCPTSLKIRASVKTDAPTVLKYSLRGNRLGVSQPEGMIAFRGAETQTIERMVKVRNSVLDGNVTFETTNAVVGKTAKIKNYRVQYLDQMHTQDPGKVPGIQPPNMQKQRIPPNIQTPGIPQPVPKGSNN